MSEALAGKIKKETGKGVNRKLRAQGRTPAVFYNKVEHFGLTVDSKEMEKFKDLHGATELVELAIEGDSKKSRTVILKDMQTHPIKPGLVHIDFQEVDMKEKITIDIPIHLVGHSPGEKMGGIVNHMMKILHIKCLPSDIPSEINVLMEEVQLNQVVHVSDLQVPENIEILNQPGDSVVTIAELKEQVEETPPLREPKRKPLREIKQKNQKAKSKYPLCFLSLAWGIQSRNMNSQGITQGFWL